MYRGAGNSSSDTADDINKKSLMFNCNLDSIDSVSEFMRRVYSVITPKCFSFQSRIRKYGDKKRNHIVCFLTLPKSLINLMFSEEEQDKMDMKETLDIKLFYDKNIFKKIDKTTGKEEVLVLVKIIKDNKKNVNRF